MENFYDKFKDKMSHPPSEEPTDWAVWDKVNEGLERGEKSRVLPLWFWLPACLAAVGLLGYYWGNVNNTNHSFASAESVHDTIYIDKLSVVHDTIFQNQIVEKWRTKEVYVNNETITQEAFNVISAKNQLLALNLEKYTSTIANHPIRKNPIFGDLPGVSEYLAKVDIKLNEKSNTIGLQQNANDTGERLSFDIDLLNRSISFDILNFDRKLVAASLTTNDMVRMKSKKSFSGLIVPDYVNIGASIDVPRLTRNSDGQLGAGVAVGFNTELLFSKRFSIIGGVHLNINRTTISDELVAMIYPQPSQVLLGESFKKLIIGHSTVNVPLMTKYKLTTDRKFDHFITFGTTISWTKQIEYKYEFTPEAGVGETYYELKSQDKPSFIYGRAGYGLEYQLNPNFNVFSEVYISIPLKSSMNAEEYSGIGFRFGVYYSI